MSGSLFYSDSCETIQCCGMAEFPHAVESAHLLPEDAQLARPDEYKTYYDEDDNEISEDISEEIAYLAPKRADWIGTLGLTVFPLVPEEAGQNCLLLPATARELTAGWDRYYSNEQIDGNRAEELRFHKVTELRTAEQGQVCSFFLTGLYQVPRQLPDWQRNNASRLYLLTNEKVGQFLDVMVLARWQLNPGAVRTLRDAGFAPRWYWQNPNTGSELVLITR